VDELPLPPNDDLPPMSRQQLKALFDYLDRPNPPACSHSFAETIEFLNGQSISAKQTVEWLQRNGAFCDCEVIYNTESEWGEYSGRQKE
jgi:Protein of unknown function (DUF2695)